MAGVLNPDHFRGLMNHSFYLPLAVFFCFLLDQVVKLAGKPEFTPFEAIVLIAILTALFFLAEIAGRQKGIREDLQKIINKP